tara:strand:+ start:520 stop:660 length:141 start_codon:yes stop_codon:yes gene_type:complete
LFFAIDAAKAAGLSLLKMKKKLIVGSTTVAVGVALMIALRNEDDQI